MKVPEAETSVPIEGEASPAIPVSEDIVMDPQKLKSDEISTQNEFNMEPLCEKINSDEKISFPPENKRSEHRMLDLFRMESCH